MGSLIDAFKEFSLAFAAWRERTSERMRERNQRVRLALWKQMQFEEQISKIYKDFQQAIPDAELTYVGKYKAIITGTNPIDGTPFEYTFLP